MNNQGLEKKEIKNHPTLKTFHMSIFFLTYELSVFVRVLSIISLLVEYKEVLTNTSPATLAARRKLA